MVDKAAAIIEQEQFRADVAVAELRRAARSLPLHRRAWRLARRKPLGAVSLVLVVFMIVVALGADLIAPYGYNDSLRGHLLEGPSAQFPMGTDNYARDILSRIIHGARVSLAVGITSVIVGVIGGALFGIVSGFFEGKLDLAIQRVMDAQMALPTIILALTIVAAIGVGLVNVMVAIGLSQIPRVNRIVRGSVMAEKRNVYVDAAGVIGCTTARIMFRHILPNVTAPIIVIATVTLAQSILIEASLSFLGVGVPPPTPSWGSMLSQEARRYMLAQPWMAIWPGLAISLVVLGWNLFGDALRDVWDPRLRGGR